MEPASQQTAEEELARLVVRLPQAQHTAEVFSMFAEHADQVFPGLQHMSILLLPKESTVRSTGGAEQTAGPAGTQASGPANSTGSTTGSTSSGRKQSSKAANAEPPAAIQSAAAGSKREAQADSSSHSGRSSNEAPAAERASGFRAGGSLSWGNCCVFHVRKGRGPLVQAPPSWPLSCTAGYHAAAVAEAAVVTGDYAAHGPHFLDWKALHEQGAAAMVAAPMLSCGKPMAVLCLASSQKDAFASTSRLQLLCGALAPYAAQLDYTTKRKQMQVLVNELITPIAAQLAQQKQSQQARSGYSTTEKAAAVASSDGSSGATAGAAIDSRGGVGGRRMRGSGSSGHIAAGAVPVAVYGEPNKDGVLFEAPVAAAGAVAGVRGRGREGREGASGGSISHKRFESVILKSSPYDLDPLGVPTDVDLDWGDFFFNLVSMAIVYVYFSKAAVAGESLVAILLCMGVAAFDIVLLAMRWLWFEQYINYGSVVLGVFQMYRVVVLPIANTWMSWSLLHKMEVTPSYGVIALLGLLLLAFVIMGTQVRFFLHAPLQLASVLFAATSTPDICGTLLQGNTSSLRCIGMISALQLSLGLLLPSAMVYFLEARGSSRSFMPHMQAKRWLQS